MPIKKTVTPAEYEECKAFWEYAQYKPLMRDYLIKLTNEGKRSAFYGKSLLNIGMRPGIPDYFYPLPNVRWHGLWIEMKRRDGSKTKKNPKQDEWIAKLIAVGQYACYAYGAEDAISIWNKYVTNQL